MSKKQKEQTISINEIEHKVSNFSPEQISLVNHVSDLDRKIQSSNFNLEQLQFGREAFMSSLTASLEVQPEVQPGE